MSQAKDDLYQVGDKVVYPGQGICDVIDVKDQEYSGFKETFYYIKPPKSTDRIIIPKNKLSDVGLRPVISKKEASKVLDILQQKDVKIDNQTWNRRFREYMEKIQTGSVYEIAEVLRDLFLLKGDKELSYGERQLLDKSRNLLLPELSLATSKSELEKEELKEMFGL